MRILVTGHLGYIGTVLAPMLVRHGHDVVGVDADLYERCTVGDPACIVAVPTRHVDIRDIGVHDLHGFEAVAHLAALSNDALGNFRPPLTDVINHRAAVRLARCAKAAKVQRFVFASTCANYGAGGGAWLDEDSSFKPLTPYTRAKVQAERAIRALADERFSPVVLRIGTVYGFSPRLRFDLVVNNLVAWASATGRVRLTSDGGAWRPLVHVQDVARAFAAVLETKRQAVHGQVFNVGRSDQNFQIRDVAERVAHGLPGGKVCYASRATFDPRCYRVRCERLFEALPELELDWDLDAGIRELHEAYARCKLAPEAFEGARFGRLAHLQQCIVEGQIDESLRRIDGSVRAHALA